MSRLLHTKYTVLWMDWFREDANFDAEGVSHCCEDMTHAVTDVCKQRQANAFECPDMLVSFSPMFREYGLIIHDGAQSMVIKFCPWCGTELPSALRETWFDRLEEAGFPEPFDKDTESPQDFKCAAWWQKEQ